ncbi:hypothetical protein D3Z50_02490 [Clostridiaceae bacterium]|nr:hypothetical protein [Clostridium sp.]NBI69953.1 hypothetical protein [Clostridiaceae bacterium]
MGQLIRATTTPIEIIRFSQNARLIPSNMVDVERRKVIARHNAFQHQTTGGASVDMNFMSRVNRTFSARQHTSPVVPEPVDLPKASSHSSAQGAAVRQQAAYSRRISSVPAAEQAAELPIPSGAARTEVSFSDVDAVSMPLDTQSQSAYTAQRGAFELRVAKGELSYVPAMVMTIVTQLPQVNFEYIGGFNYVPPDWGQPLGSNLNCSI